MIIQHPRINASLGAQFRQGFTLLELIISAGLSIVIILLAYAAVRTAGKAVSGMERASIQNGMIRTSFIIVAEATRVYADVGTLAPANLSIPPPSLPPTWPKAPTWPTATLIRSGPSSGTLTLGNDVTGVTTKIDFAVTGAR